VGCKLLGGLDSLEIEENKGSLILSFSREVTFASELLYFSTLIMSDSDLDDLVRTADSKATGIILTLPVS